MRFVNINHVGADGANKLEKEVGPSRLNQSRGIESKMEL